MLIGYTFEELPVARFNGGPARVSRGEYRKSVPGPKLCKERENAARTLGSFGRPLHVLVVDDYLGTAETMARLLRLQGYEADAAQSGVVALQLAQVQRPDAVLLDVLMPGMSGLDVARRLRQMFPDQPLLLIAITANGFEQDRRDCLEAGFDVYFVKPADPNQVEQFLRAWGRRFIGLTERTTLLEDVKQRVEQLELQYSVCTS
jgi:CheY-like chemotaxis protein